MTTTRMNRRWLLRERPTGDFDPKIMERVVEPAPEPGPGQALVRNRFLSLDPTNRIWMSEAEGYMPPVELGTVMRGGGIGEVVASNSSKFKVGAKVAGLLNWQDYAIVSDDDEIAQVIPNWPPIPMHMTQGVLGVTGMTAYFGLLDIGKPKKGETVVVSAAAGAVGSIVGQIAKIQGCRAVGIAGSDEKCKMLVEELGFDAAINRRNPDWREKLKAACPNGVDVNFENAGGEIMEAVMDLMNLHGRVALCGMISQYGKDEAAMGPRNFRHVLIRRFKIQGFIILDYIPRFPLAQLRMLWWIKRGLIKDRSTIIKGLDKAPEALVGLYEGTNTGKLLIEIDDPPG